MTRQISNSNPVPEAQALLDSLVERFQPERALVLKLVGTDWTILAHFASAQPYREPGEWVSTEVLEHIASSEEARIFASPMPGVEPLGALLGGALEVVMAARHLRADEWWALYLARPLKDGLYGEAELDLLHSLS